MTPRSLQLLLDHQDAVAPEHNDPIHELLDDLGEVPTIESLIGEALAGGRGPAPPRVRTAPALSARRGQKRGRRGRF